MSNVELLGKARVWFEDDWQLIPNDKRGALLIYLAMQADWVTREALAFIFWPDTDSKTAKANLRQLLRRTKLLPYTSSLESEGQQLRWSVKTDLSQFMTATQANEWVTATEIYNGHLAQDFVVVEAEGFSAWLELERSELQHLWHQVVEQGSEALAKTDRHTQAAALIKKVWQLDSFDERLLRNYMTQAALAGNSESALKVYTGFKEVLEAEMQLEPVEDTQLLAKQIEAGDFTSEQSPNTTSTDILAPTPTTTFVGREKDITELKTALTTKQQIFALLGLGGVGKSRLALEVGQQLITSFEHGVSFVPLASATADTILSAIAEALNFSFYGNQDPKTQLFDYLRKKEMLLIIDNFEHLTEHVDILLELAQEAPKLKLLITSREKPEIAKLWTHQLSGLAHDATDSPALALFLDAAKVHAPSFKANDADLELIQELCQTVEGLPLALELAAAWVAELSTQDILDEIKRNLSSLQHADNSIDAVLEHSWSLLSPEQQSTLAKLSVFRGGFTKEAAQTIADASNYLNLSLLNRSLIRQQHNRYDMHEMVRQFASQKLIEDGTAEETVVKHGAFFSNLVEAQQNTILSELQLEALELLSQDIDNIRFTWQFAIESQESQNNSSIAFLDTLGTYYTIKSLFHEGATNFKTASQNLSDTELAELSILWQATLLQGQGLDQEVLTLLENLEINQKSQFKARAQLLLGISLAKTQDFQKAEEHLEIALKQFKTLKKQLNPNWYSLMTLNELGNVALYQGEYPKALDYYQQALDLAKANNDLWQLSRTFSNLGTIKDLTGNYAEAEALHKESLSLKETLDDKDGIAVCYLNLGTVQYVQGNYTDAQPLFEQSHTIFRALGNLRRQANAINNLTAIRFTLGHLDEAEQNLHQLCDIYKNLDDKGGLAKCFFNLGTVEKQRGNPTGALAFHKKSLALYKEIGNQAGMITAHSGKAYALVSLENFEAAWTEFQVALKIATDIDAIPKALDILDGIMQLLIELEQPKHAFKLAFLINEHPAVLAATKNKVQKRLTKLQDGLVSKSEAKTILKKKLSYESLVTKILSNPQPANAFAV